MSKLVVRFEGRFAVWSYTVGHGRLLLRRTKSGTHNTRVDILFKDVGALYLPMKFDDIAVEELPIDSASQLLAQLGSVDLRDRTVFGVSGDRWRGLVIAGIVAWHEDELEYDQPSPLLE